MRFYYLIINKKFNYDTLGRVIEVEDSCFANHTYQYDYRGNLIKADNVEYNYDSNGNILSIGEKTFTYDENVKDLLIKVDNKNIEYDTNNPGIIKKYDGNEYTFEGRILKTLTNLNGNYTYVYDDKGLRTCKYKSGENWIYQYDDDKLVYQLHNNIRLDFLYDENGKLYGFIKDNTDKYFYIKDDLNNILGIINSSGEFVVKYEYDPFGVCTSIKGTLASTIGVLNPFRYKGYYFDSESNMYYCKSRYYVPEWGRWLNYDSANFLDIENINGLNLYCYCQNNPISYYDEDGDLSKWAKTLIVAVAGVAVIAGVVAVTVATGGLAAPVLKEAGFGAVTGGVSSAAMQYLSEGKVDLSKVIIDATVGGVMGAFGASTLGKVGMTIAGSITGAASSVASDWVEDKEIDIKAALGSAFIGGALAFASGPARQFSTKSQSNSLKQVINKISDRNGHWKKGLTKIYKNKLEGISKQVINTIKNEVAKDFGTNCISFVVTSYF